MKRDRFAGDYDKIRRDAGYARPRYDLDDPEEPDLEREGTLQEGFRERAEQLRQAEAAEEAKKQASKTAFTLETNERMRLRQFELAGVEPPAGFKCSLSLLLSMGWSIGEVKGKKVLVRPFAPAPRKEEDDRGCL